MWVSLSCCTIKLTWPLPLSLGFRMSLILCLCTKQKLLNSTVTFSCTTVIRVILSWCCFSVGGEGPKSSNLYYPAFPLYSCKTVLVVSNFRQLSKPASYWFPYNQIEVRRLCDFLDQMIMIPETVCREAPKQTSARKTFTTRTRDLGTTLSP